MDEMGNGGFDKFLIAPYKSGLRRDLETWLTPRDSFRILQNVNIKRGKFVKRFGEELIGNSHEKSRARVKVGVTDAAGGPTAGNVPGTIWKVGQIFTIGNDVYTVELSGLQTMLTTSATGVGTFDTSNGSFTFNNTANSVDIYWYPAEPIMAISHYEKGPVNEHETFVFDTQFIYKYNGNSFDKDTTQPTPFKGSDTNFFWSTNFIGASRDNIALFITNFNAKYPTPSASDDNMFYYDGSNWNDFSVLTKFNSNQDLIISAKIIIAWKDRLFLLGVIERNVSTTTNTAFLSRVRYSHNGSPLSATAWLQGKTSYAGNEADGGGFIDLPVEEEIVSATIIKDRLIVYCERSTWELIATGNPAIPFTWVGISTSAGSASTFSTVDFDNESVTISINGIYACNGSDVARIDRQIPNEVFSFLKTSTGTSRIQGIRDFYNDLAYWSVLDFADAKTHRFPNKLLVFNYIDKSWSMYDDTITAFGYIEQTSSKDWSFGNWDISGGWGTYYQQGDSRFILAGNHQGFLFKVNNELPKNAPVMTVAKVTITSGKAYLLIPSHNIADGEFIYFEDQNLSYNNDGIFKARYLDENNIVIEGGNIAGTYLGGGTVTRVSRITMQSNEWNPYVQTGDRLYLSKIDFCVTNTIDGEVIVDYDLDSLGWSFIEHGVNSGAILGNNVLEMHAYKDITIEKFKDTLWRTIYFQASADFVNIEITLSDDQMVNKNISMSPFELQGMILYTSRENQ